MNPVFISGRYVHFYSLVSFGAQGVLKSLSTSPFAISARFISCFQKSAAQTSVLSSQTSCNSRLQHTRKMSDSEEEVLVEEVNCKGIITLNRPKSLNALNESMVNKLFPILKNWETKKKLIIIKGAGEKAFCAGGDVVCLTSPERRNDPTVLDFFKAEYTLNNLIGTYKIPYVSFITGIVMGGGAGVSINGKYRIASERSLFAMPETAIGLFPDVGGSYFLPRLGGGLGMFLALTGHRLKGSDLVRVGLATHFCPGGRLDDMKAALLALPHNTQPEHVAALLDAFDTRQDDFSLSPYLRDIKDCFTAPSLQEILDKLKHSESAFCREKLKVIESMCPTSVAITHEQIRRGAKLSLQECLKMEFRMVNRVVQGTEFREGVRARLVDKDNAPKWQPSSLQEVDRAMIESYFAPLPQEQELVLPNSR